MRLINNVFLLTLSAVLLFSCGSDKTADTLKEKIELAEKRMKSGASVEITRQAVIDFRNACMEYVEKFPDDSLAAGYLFKAAEAGISLMEPTSCIAQFSKFRKDYPSHERAADALFLTAFVYETQALNLDSAKFCYQEFIKNYPEHLLVKDAEASIRNLGKTPEELIREFENMQQDSVKTADV
jgi:outer membrane protein assembly factor BamD (BamD/ComL family)